MADGEKQSLGLSGQLPKDLSWYEIKPDTAVGEKARKLLIDWSKIPADKIDAHVEKIRKEAFAIFPYPCIGMFRFLDLSILTQPVYPEVLERLKNGQKFLDLGCCFGQEVRQLASDGAPIPNLHGTDLKQEFLDLGNDLFLDAEKFPNTFFPSDIFDANSSLNNLDGKIDIVYTGSFFHLFDYADQYKIALRVVKLLSPKSGSMLIGRQVGNVNPGDYAREGYPGEQKRFRHDGNTWKELWRKVGEETGTKWDVEAHLEDHGFGMGGSGKDGKGEEKNGESKLEELRHEPGTKRIRFVVRRV